MSARQRFMRCIRTKRFDNLFANALLKVSGTRQIAFELVAVGGQKTFERVPNNQEASVVGQHRFTLVRCESAEFYESVNWQRKEWLIYCRWVVWRLNGRTYMPGEWARVAGIWSGSVPFDHWLVISISNRFQLVQATWKLNDFC